MVSQEIIITFLSGLTVIFGGGTVVGLVSYFKLKPEKELASYPALIAQIQTTLILPLEEKVTKLEKKTEILTEKVNIYENHLMGTKKGAILVEKTRKQFAS